MQTAVLLGLLGAAALAAVSSAPVDNRNHNEEMVTHCIIEVLSSALSKSSVPTVTPECRQVLKKSGKEFKGEEKGENENTKFEVRLLRDPADASEAHSSREETGTSEEDTQGQTKEDNEKWTEGGGHSREGADESLESLHPSKQQVSKEAKIHHSGESGGEKREEEEGKNYPKAGHREDAGEEKHLEAPGEKQSTFSNQRSDTMAKEKEESLARADTHSVGLYENTQGRERGSQESGEEARRQEKQPQELSNHNQSEEESEEEEEEAAAEVAKRRPRHHHGRSRPNSKSSQEGHPVLEGRRHAPEESEEAGVATASLGEKRGHHPTHYRASEEEPEYGEEMRSYPGFQVPKGFRGAQYGGRGSEEDRAPWPQSEESQERESRRSHSNSELESRANRHSEEAEGERRSSEGAKEHQHRDRANEPGPYSAPDTKQEKRFLGEGHYPVHAGSIDKAKRYPPSKWQEQEKNYLNYGEEGEQGKWWQPEGLLDPEEIREEVRFPDGQYAPYPTAERRKRLGMLVNPYFDPLQWKNSDFEKKDNPGDNFLEGEGEDGNRLTLTEKNFFPEYNYDVWEERPFSEDVNWGYEKRSFARGPHLDLKRQYDGVAELDQLLHYRKKSAEFPDFYDSEEQMGPHQEAEDEKGRADQRALTDEEKKELENLAAMDLELQKIAEKFSQRG